MSTTTLPELNATTDTAGSIPPVRSPGRDAVADSPQIVASPSDVRLRVNGSQDTSYESETN